MAWLAWLEKHVMPAWIRCCLHYGRQDLKKVKSSGMDEEKRARR
jgi:hypothetical protein